MTCIEKKVVAARKWPDLEIPDLLRGQAEDAARVGAGAARHGHVWGHLVVAAVVRHAVVASQAPVVAQGAHGCSSEGLLTGRWDGVAWVCAEKLEWRCAPSIWPCRPRFSCTSACRQCCIRSFKMMVHMIMIVRSQLKLVLFSRANNVHC